MECPNCHEPILKTFKKCPECGANLLTRKIEDVETELQTTKEKLAQAEADNEELKKHVPKDQKHSTTGKPLFG